MSTGKENMTTKKCPRCKEYKTLDSFAYDKSKKNKSGQVLVQMNQTQQ